MNNFPTIFVVLCLIGLSLVLGAKYEHSRHSSKDTISVYIDPIVIIKKPIISHIKSYVDKPYQETVLVKIPSHIASGDDSAYVLAERYGRVLTGYQTVAFFEDSSASVELYMTSLPLEESIIVDSMKLKLKSVKVPVVPDIVVQNSWLEDAGYFIAGCLVTIGVVELTK